MPSPVEKTPEQRLAELEASLASLRELVYSIGRAQIDQNIADFEAANSEGPAEQ